MTTECGACEYFVPHPLETKRAKRPGSCGFSYVLPDLAPMCVKISASKWSVWRDSNAESFPCFKRKEPQVSFSR